MGGGGKGETDKSNALAAIAEDIYRDMKDVRHGLISQYEEALTTGGIGARIPIIRKAEESSQRATSDSLKALETQLAQGGLTGTPFGAQARGKMEQQGRYQTSQIGPQYIAQLLQQLPGIVAGGQQVSVQGLTGAAGAEASMAGAEAAYLQAMMSPFKFSFS